MENKFKYRTLQSSGNAKRIVAGNVQPRQMNTEQFIPYSVGCMLKKQMWRTNTAHRTTPQNEQIHTPAIYPSQIISQAIPESPPTDWRILLESEILTTFNITNEDISMFSVIVNGIQQFTVSQSEAYPYIYRITHCKLIPWIGNRDLAFSAISPTTGSNLLQNVISFNLYDGQSWRGTLYRTASNGSLSRLGKDTVLASQLAYGFDYDTGIMTCYEMDSRTFTPNPICSTNPPAVSCYIYRGMFGNYTGNTSNGNVWSQNKNYIFHPNPVVVGSSHLDSCDNALEVTGNAQIDSIVARSVDAVRLEIAGSAHMDSVQTGTLEVTGHAQIESIATESMNTFADPRLCENMVPYTPNYDILKLNTYTYNYISNAEEAEIGVLASEMEHIVPELVKERSGYKTVQYDRIGVLLIPIMEDMRKRIEVLERDNCDMKVSISTLQSR